MKKVGRRFGSKSIFAKSRIERGGLNTGFEYIGTNF